VHDIQNLYLFKVYTPVRTPGGKRFVMSGRESYHNFSCVSAHSP